MKPVLKWVGGKQGLIDQMAPYMPAPAECRGYVAPFAGGEALFFCRYSAVRPAWIADTNPELIALYRAIRDDLEELIAETGAIEHIYHDFADAEDDSENEAMYHEIAKQDTAGWPDFARGARLLFLNRTCFNGLYRTNRAGKFNVAWGQKATAKILFEDELREAHTALQGVEIRCASFEDTCRDAPIGPGVFVFADPPYVPVSESASFDSYGPNKFSWQEQGDLLTLLEQAVDKGATVAATNSWAPEIVDLYRRSRAGFNVVEISAARNIACKAKSREAVGEMLASTWRAKQ